MLDKNCDNPVASQTPESFMQELTGSIPINIILCLDSIKKTRLLGMLANLAPGPVFYLDTDLLYTGSVRAGLCKSRDRITICCPDQSTWHRDLADIISKASASAKTTVVIDSLNGVYEMFEEPDSVMSVNTHIMYLASLAGQAGSSVIVGAVVRKRRRRRRETHDILHDQNIAHNMLDMKNVTKKPTTEEWILYPSGRQVPKITANTFLLGGTRINPLLVKIAPQLW